MVTQSNRHILKRMGGWRLWIGHGGLRDGWWELVQLRLEAEDAPGRMSRHANTSIITLAAPGGARKAFLKIYRPPGVWPALKEQVRLSMPRRVLKMSQRLSRDGFRVPGILAAGERRIAGVLIGGFLLAEEVEGLELREVALRIAAAPEGDRRATKRRILSLVGSEVGRLHERGYVHGDLVATNILLGGDALDALWFVDHDRSRGPLRFRLRHRQRRNLVQLNRIDLCGVTSSDRLRAFRQYAVTRGWNAAKMRAEARRIARLTKARREEIAQAMEKIGSARSPRSSARWPER